MFEPVLKRIKSEFGRDLMKDILDLFRFLTFMVVIKQFHFAEQLDGLARNVSVIRNTS